MPSEKNAHDCGTIVLTDSLSAIHQPEKLDAWVRVKTGSDRYDLVTLPDIEDFTPESVEVLAGDIVTAISLHRNERLLAYSYVGVETLLESIREKLPEETKNHLKIEEYQLTASISNNIAIQPSDTLVISCMDWRLHGETGGLLWKLGEALGEDATDFDLLATAGGAKELVEGQRRWNVIQSRITSTNVKRIIILSHTDCGAYGGNCAFHSDYAQISELANGLHNALQTVLMSDLAVDIVTGIVHIDEKLDRVGRMHLFI